MKLARANAAIDNRDYVLPDDIKDYVYAALEHRIILQPEYWMRQHVTGDILSAIIKTVSVPVLGERQ
jgi:MoxR-like ATPase